MEITKESLLAALSEVGEILYRRGKVGDIAIYGGSAMILQFDVSFATQDVDAVINGEHGEVTRAVQEVARRHGWASSWLNEGVSVYLSPEANQNLDFYGDFPSPTRTGLRVYVASAEYILALKLRALRVASRDLQDVLTLAQHLGFTTLEQLLDVLKKNFPNEPLDARRLMILSDLVEKLNA